MSKTMLYHGDCIEVMEQMVADGVKVDAILTDPPYGTTACKWDSVIPFDKMWPLLNSLIKPKGAIVLFGSEPFSSAMVMSNISKYKHRWVWNKKQMGNFANAKFMPLQVFEDILVFSNGKVNYYPQMRTGKMRKKGGRKKLCQSMSSFIKPEYFTYNDQYYPINILEYPNCSNKKNNVHPTQKPIALMEYLIKTYTIEGETVLDFTMGSGSTGVACVNTGRAFIGIEKDATYFDIAVKRIADAEKEKAGALL